MASNPVPLLPALADTPAKQQDIKSLQMFLFLLREQIGGDSAYEDLSVQIAANTADIAANDISIATNTTNIATNTTNIATNTAAIAAIPAKTAARVSLRV